MKEQIPLQLDERAPKVDLEERPAAGLSEYHLELSMPV